MKALLTTNWLRGTIRVEDDCGKAKEIQVIEESAIRDQRSGRLDALESTKVLSAYAKGLKEYLEKQGVTVVVFELT